MPPDWTLPFRCHVDPCQSAVGGTLTEMDKNGDEKVVSYLSKWLSPAEEKYTANDLELLGFIYFLQWFPCYLESVSFEVMINNQVLNNFFNKTNPSRKETRWLYFLGQFRITAMTLVQGKANVLGDALSRAPHVLNIDGTNPEMSNIQSVETSLPRGWSRTMERTSYLVSSTTRSKANSQKMKFSENKWKD